MPDAGLGPLPQQYFDNNGFPLAGGLVSTFAAGTSTPLDSYTDHTGTVVVAQPTVLDASGRGVLWLAVGVGYKIRVTDADGVDVWELDPVLVVAQGAGLPEEVSLEVVTETLEAEDGAALVTVPGFFEVGHEYLVSLRVTETFNTSNGLVSLALGEPSITGRFGSQLPPMEGATNGAGALVRYAPASTRDLCLVAEGGLFGPGGAAVVCATVFTPALA